MDPLQFVSTVLLVGKAHTELRIGSKAQINPWLYAPRRGYRTARNQQLNAKATPETIEKFYKLANERNVPLGELTLEARSRSARKGRGVRHDPEKS